MEAILSANGQETNQSKITLNIIQPDQIITNDWTAIQIARVRPPPEWIDVFKAADEEISDVSDILENENSLCFAVFF